jgi:membrane-associated phospholipid phosphatase
MLPQRICRFIAATLAIGTMGFIAPSVQAQTAPKSGFSEFISGAGTALFLGGGALLPLVTDGDKGGQRSLRMVDALLTSAALCVGAKEVFKTPRPDNPAELDSFPSCHATTAFALARVQSHYHPDYAPLWYAGAALIGYSRVDLNRHRWSDVIIGAGLGYLVGEVELGQKKGLLLFPLIREDAQGNSVIGLQIKADF